LYTGNNMSEFTMYVGPMFSGKSRALLLEMQRKETEGLNVVGLKPMAEIRDAGIESRNGLRRDAIAVKKLGEAALNPAVRQADAIGIDEIFMFNTDVQDTYKTVEIWLRSGKIVLAASLDLSGMGKQMSVVTALSELGPKTLTCTEAICNTEHDEPVTATHTRIYDINTNVAIREGLPELVPQDPINPKYGFSPACRDCFFEWSPVALANSA
jgi:thymidine kinase